MSHTFRFEYTGSAEQDSERLIQEVEAATRREKTSEQAFAEYLHDMAAYLKERADLVEPID